MRLISVILRNYRLHRELGLDFDPSRTLVGGNNETGKSTIIEAVHRALFLKGKGNTEYHKAMTSSLHMGQPEVELTFEKAGIRYLVKKRFGPNGSTTLAPSNSGSFIGEEAEAKLARVLNVEAGLSGKTMASQWAHLWVWQGQACGNPSAHASTHVNGLLQRLQQIGGGGALQSERDARVAEYFSNLYDTIYTQAGRPKTGSPLELAERSAAAAQERLRLATERIQKLESAAEDLETASKTILSTEVTIAELQLEREKTVARAKRLQVERQHELEHSNAARMAGERCVAIENANSEIASARTDISSLREGLKPKEEVIARLEAAFASAKTTADAAEDEVRKANVAIRQARLAHELAVLRVQLMERSEVFRKLTEKKEKVLGHTTALAGLEEQLSKLAKLDRNKLQKIQRLESEVSRSCAALQAMATAIEVIAADKPVKIGDESILPGQRRILTEESEILAGPGIRLLVKPGGGTSLGDARKNSDDAAGAFRSFLDSLGIASSKEAIEIGAQRDDLTSRIKSARAEIAGMEAENIDEELDVARNNVTASTADVDRHRALVEEPNVPADLESAETFAKALKRVLRDAENRETEANAASTVSTRALQDAEQARVAAKETVVQQTLSLGRREAQLELLLNSHGDDASRNRALSGFRGARMATEALLAATTAAIAELQPELLEEDQKRIERAIEAATEQQNNARSQVAVAKAVLGSDGNDDPATEFAAAQAKIQSAEEERLGQLRNAQAVALLNTLFRQEQRGLAERFTKPLADKISGYLRCIFGPDAGVQLSMEDNQFTDLRLLRPRVGNSPFEFEALSEGAKEQTAAAYRLAMAEVLAADYEGCLPVVFDDAFAYSDPERVGQLQRMLNLAATRGLQVIILTCNPADYAALGAKLFTLRLDPYLPRSSALGSSVSGASAPDKPSDQSQSPPTIADDPLRVVVADEFGRELLEALSAAGGSSGNGSLRERLGWDEATYLAVKGVLLAAGKLQSGKGRGGSVSLVPG